MTVPGPFYLIAAATLGTAAYLLNQGGAAAGDTASNPDNGGALASLQDAFDETAATVVNMVSPNPANDMQVSEQQKAVLKQREGLRLTRYFLGDGVATIGYGRSGTAAQIPANCTQAQADAWFESDLEARAAKWVRLYVTVPVTQAQFDAMVDIAYNMSPRSFKRFADSVNAGRGIDAIAQQSVSWVASTLQNGIQNRRNAEMNQFDNGVYS